MTETLDLAGYVDRDKCPQEGCGHFTGNHGLRGCYVPGCRCRRTCCDLDHGGRR